MRIIATFVAALLAATCVNAQSWPTKPVRLIVPFPPGGPSDTLGRVVAERLSKSYGQQFITENRPGAAGNIGAEVVARSAPDGYTLFLSPPGPHGAHQFLYRSLSFDPKKDFTPVVLVSEMPLVFAVNPKLPVSSMAELVEYAHKNPGKLSYASPGNGTIGHLAAELFKNAASVDMVHVPYKGSAPALQDLLGGQVDLAVDNLPPYARFIQSGQFRALAVTTEKRWPGLNTPTMQEAGFQNFHAASWIGIFGPAKLPADIVASVNRNMNEYLASDEGAKRLLGLGFQPRGGTPEDLDNMVKAEVTRWGPLIKRLGILLD